jgi:hypothetical protein
LLIFVNIVNFANIVRIGIFSGLGGTARVTLDHSALSIVIQLHIGIGYLIGVARTRAPFAAAANIRIIAAKTDTATIGSSLILRIWLAAATLQAGTPLGGGIANATGAIANRRAANFIRIKIIRFGHLGDIKVEG